MMRIQAKEAFCLSRKFLNIVNLLMTFGVLGVSAPQKVLAIDFTPSSVANLTAQSMVDSLLRTVALGADHRDYMPASNLGIALGFDVGVDFTAIKLPTEFSDAFALVTGQAAPTYLPLPRLSFHKGLPFGLDMGFSYLGLTDPSFTVKMYGGSLKWTFMGGLALPSLAAKVTGNYTSIGFINTHTYKLDLMVSKSFVVFEPYVGVGMASWTGDLSYPVTLGPLPATISGHSSGTNAHYYGGMMFKLLVLRLAAEADFNSAGFSSYGLKTSLGF